MSSGPVVVVDGDVIVYRSGFAAQTGRYLAKHKETKVIIEGPNQTDLKKQMEELGTEFDDYFIKKQVKAEPVENCLHSVKMQMESIREHTRAKKLRIILSGQGNYREKVATFLPYKGTRLTRPKRRAMIDAGLFPHFFEQYTSAGAGRPIHYDAIREYLIKYWNAEVVPGMEADDKLAMLQASAHEYCMKNDPGYWNDTVIPKVCVVASIDKDLHQVPGWFYDFVKDEWDFVTPEQADVNLWSQLWSGDMTDCIYGIKGKGLKGAIKTIKDIPEDERHEYVLQRYEDWFMDMQWDCDSGVLEKPIDKYLVNNYEPRKYANEVYQLVYLLRNEKELERYAEKEEANAVAS